MKTIVKLINRIKGRSYPVDDIYKIQITHGRKSSHIHACWTSPEHWSHNNYERSHLPQICVIASGWKARILACIFLPQTPWIPYDEQ